MLELLTDETSASVRHYKIYMNCVAFLSNNYKVIYYIYKVTFKKSTYFLNLLKGGILTDKFPC